MSVLSRVTAPTAGHDLASVVGALLSSPQRPAPKDLSQLPAQRLGQDSQPAESLLDRLVTGPTGLGTSAARIFRPSTAAEAAVATSEPTSDQPPDLELYCPPAVRDDEALGEEVNDRLVDWAGQVGIYPGQLDKVHKANFGRLMMLTHPATSDPDRLLAASKCVLAEWATDDHFLDEESLGADATLIASRLGITYGAIDPVDLPICYAPQLDKALSEEPVAVAYPLGIRAPWPVRHGHAGRPAAPRVSGHVHGLQP